jgi:hypothetical protein
MDDASKFGVGQAFQPAVNLSAKSAGRQTRPTREIEKSLE